jgi:GMP synthase-like glutamine amidotransferase
VTPGGAAAMKPVLILQHEADVAAGHFGTWLAARGRPHVLAGVHRGDRVPSDPGRYAGLCSMGGNMSVNDALDWIDDEVVLMRAAVDAGIPVIGHCLGGQLLARALGAHVRRNPFREMGWLPVRTEDLQRVTEWFGDTSLGELFHWHGDAFDLPAGAHRLLSTPLTPNQAFVAERGGVGHVGMQFHIEMTPALVESWAREPGAAEEVAEERARTGGAGVQTPDEMCRDLERRTAAMKTHAWRLYDRWARGLRD